MAAYKLMQFISWLVCHQPHCLNRALAWLLGHLGWYVVPKWRRYMAKENIKDCLGVGDAEAEAIAKESVTRFGRMLIEVLRYPLLTKDNFRNIVHFEGLENLEKAYAENKGICMATAHYGNWEMLGASMALLGYPILSITRKQNNGAMDRFINDYRRMVGQHVTYNHGGNSMLAIGRYLKEKHLVGILYDQDSAHTGEHLLFFGKPSRVPDGAAHLSRIFGAPIVPLFMHNNPDGTLTARIYPALHTPKTADRDADVSGIMKELMVIAEREIKLDPAMWFWVHDRWKDGRKRYEKYMKGV
ncbi:lysophospholipid acyltransferase family protein [Acidaminococcus sp. NSJ-142]|jgi:KDO2-lipid IV(A) lauroyltransferase|uniref:lysophospholipid acyltransferase family protein n=1 Tax=Acidaminococcus TaxID=904 RepID=UPI000E5511AD|nr:MULTISPECIES: lysophospholipid acyltransferase family protein [Acidaminococcus]MCD2435207.1 lysophospholipid acyltransferase family protein [Acidaminococcus hominis]MCH4097194.1 lysophospholipid acyltransferase family protein [Acidaminococcus provencensis]RHK02096.1 lipid A biosynthesis acyltransferase [Acidaminococcus sp. AM05-11]